MFDLKRNEHSCLRITPSKNIYFMIWNSNYPKSPKKQELVFVRTRKIRFRIGCTATLSAMKCAGSLVQCKMQSSSWNAFILLAIIFAGDKLWKLDCGNYSSFMRLTLPLKILFYQNNIISLEWTDYYPELPCELIWYEFRCLAHRVSRHF